VLVVGSAHLLYIFNGNPERKGQRVRRKHILEDNIKMDLKEIEYNGVDLIYLSKIGTCSLVYEYY
jgi:hypothetical protein